MRLRYSEGQRTEYLVMTERIGRYWLDVFRGDTTFYSAAYWDLFTGLWRAREPVRKTDALGFMKAVRSAHTAGKYADAAIRHGLVVESENPEDARSKLLSLTADMRERLDAFLDHAVSEVRKSNHAIEVMGPLPEEP